MLSALCPARGLGLLAGGKSIQLHLHLTDARQLGLQFLEDFVHLGDEPRDCTIAGCASPSRFSAGATRAAQTARAASRLSGMTFGGHLGIFILKKLRIASVWYRTERKKCRF